MIPADRKRLEVVVRLAWARFGAEHSRGLASSADSVEEIRDAAAAIVKRIDDGCFEPGSVADALIARPMQARAEAIVFAACLCCDGG